MRDNLFIEVDENCQIVVIRHLLLLLICSIIISIYIITFHGYILADKAKDKGKKALQEKVNSAGKALWHSSVGKGSNLH